MQVAIATSFYESARPYLADWVDGVRRAVPDSATLELVVAAHGFIEPQAALVMFAQRAILTVAPVAAEAPIATVRNAMLAAAARSTADIVVFCDADDALLDDAAAAHAAALVGADFSYGDMVPVNAAGRRLGTTFFEGRDVPRRAVGAVLVERNFVGFSNAAVRTTILQRHLRPAPDDVIAVDWFLFSTLLAAGAQGARVDASVAAYRQHDGNLLGTRAASDLTAARRRCDMAARHYAGLADPSQAPRRAVLARLMSDDGLLARALERTPEGPLLWFEDVAAWVAFAAVAAREAA